MPYLTQNRLPVSMPELCTIETSSIPFNSSVDDVSWTSLIKHVSVKILKYRGLQVSSTLLL